MRPAATAGIGLALLGTFAAISARPDDGAPASVADDMPAVTRRDVSGLDGRTWWCAWWYANRAWILRPSYRAGSAGGGLVESADDEARERARAALLAALGDDDELVASEAALALGRGGDPRDIAPLSAIVASGGGAALQRLDRFAAIGLGLIPAQTKEEDAAARQALLGALRAGRGEGTRGLRFRQHCAYALAMRGDHAALPDLLELRRRRGVAPGGPATATLHADLLGAICFPLAVLGGDAVIPDLEEHLRGAGRGAQGGETAWAACHAFARIPGAAARRILREASVDDREAVRAAAVQALAAVTAPDDDEVAALLRLTLARDRDSRCRQMAAISLGRIAHLSAAPTLLEAAESASAPDRPFVWIALGLCARSREEPKVEAALLRALTEAGASEQQRMAIALACGLAGIDEARPRLAELASRGRSPDVAAQAVFALGLLGAGADERDVLHDAAMRKGSVLLRREASLALGMLRDHAIVVRLREAVASTENPDDERALSAVCLGRVGDDEDLNFLAAAVQDRRAASRLRAAFVRALGHLLDRQEGAALALVAADAPWDAREGADERSALWELQHLVD